MVMCFSATDNSSNPREKEYVMPLAVYNTMSRTVEEFQPIEKGKVSMYCCGPTVYNYAHIGNLRTYIFEDILHRVLTYAGYKVKHVMNITDVGHLTGDGDDGEDKMLKSAREKGQSVWDIAQFYTDAFFRDFDALDNQRPQIVCKATDHVQQMIELIRRLEEKGHTYVAGGNLYFSIDTFPDYGKLAGLHLHMDDLKAGARIEVDTFKRNPKDFVLWFTNSKFGEQAMMWDSPWGRGYPGWHIECSAMSMTYLGDKFDLHCGGIDAIPVHHTNEIAQSEAATGEHPWVKYWMHGEFLLNDTGKMSKSSGEFLTLQVLVDKGYDPLDYRFFCLGAHYRTQLRFSWEALDGARASRKNLVGRVARLKAEAGSPSKHPGEAASGYLSRFTGQIFNDLNMPRALAVMWGLLKDDSVPAADKLAVLLEMDRVLGMSLEKVDAQEDSSTDAIAPEAMEMVRQRTEAKKARDFATADRLRAQLEEAGYVVMDTPAGTTLSKKEM